MFQFWRMSGFLMSTCLPHFSGPEFQPGSKLYAATHGLKFDITLASCAYSKPIPEMIGSTILVRMDAEMVLGLLFQNDAEMTEVSKY